MGLLGMYHHFRPKSPNLIQLQPFPGAAWLQSWTKTFYEQSPAFEYGWPDEYARAKLTVCPVVLAKDLDTS